MTTLDDRATTRTVTLPDGMRVRTFRPPQGFDLATASDDELARVGLPARPSQPELGAHYDAVRAKLARKFTYVPASLRLLADVAPGQVVGPRFADSSSNWSGAVVYAAAGATLEKITADWVVPNVYCPADGQWHYASSWIGLDGDGSSDICQAGVTSYLYRSGSTIQRYRYPYFAWFPGSAVTITNLPVNAGDLITVTICANAAAATLTFTNQTTGATTSLGFSAPAGTTLTGNCAEWVVSDSVNANVLADYGQVFFANASVLGNGGAVGAGTGDLIRMVDAAGDTLSQGVRITDTIVQCVYTGAKPTS